MSQTLPPATIRLPDGTVIACEQGFRPLMVFREATTLSLGARAPQQLPAQPAYRPA